MGPNYRYCAERVLGLRRPLRRPHPRRDRRAPLRRRLRARPDHPPLPAVLLPRHPAALAGPDPDLPADAARLEAARQAVPGDRPQGLGPGARRTAAIAGARRVSRQTAAPSSAEKSRISSTATTSVSGNWAEIGLIPRVPRVAPAASAEDLERAQREQGPDRPRPQPGKAARRLLHRDHRDQRQDPGLQALAEQARDRGAPVDGEDDERDDEVAKTGQGQRRAARQRLASRSGKKRIPSPNGTPVQGWKKKWTTNGEWPKIRLIETLSAWNSGRNIGTKVFASVFSRKSIHWIAEGSVVGIGLGRVVEERVLHVVRPVEEPPADDPDRDAGEEQQRGARPAGAAAGRR